MNTFELTPELIESRCFGNFTDHQLYVGMVKIEADFIEQHKSVLTEDQRSSKAYSFISQFRTGCFSPTAREVKEAKIICAHFKNIITSSAL